MRKEICEDCGKEYELSKGEDIMPEKCFDCYEEARAKQPEDNGAGRK